MYFLRLILLCLLLTGYAFGQVLEIPCGAEAEHAFLLRHQTGYAAAFGQVDRLIALRILEERTQSSRSSDTARYEIPVVFHIMHENGLEEIPLSRVVEEVANLNEIYRNRGVFDQGAGVDMHINFCLAKRDPQGLASSGAEHIRSGYTRIRSRGENYDMRRQHNWDPRNYLNIYVVRSIRFYIGNDTLDVIGTGIYPPHAGTGIDAVTLRYDHVGVPGRPEISTTLAHEIGHYLGLYHPFNDGCANDDCLIQGDRVCDTPPDDRIIFDEGCIANNNCYTDADDPRPVNPFAVDVDDLNRLYMDYNVEGCRYMFTPGQRERVRAVIRHLRPGLLRNAACDANIAYDMAIDSVLMPGPVPCFPTFQPQIRLVNRGSQDLYSAIVSVRLAGWGWQQQAWSGDLAPGEAALVQMGMVNPVAGPHTLEFFIESLNGQADEFALNDSMRVSFTLAEPIHTPKGWDFENGFPRDWAVTNPEGTTWERKADGCDPANGNAHCLVLDNQLFYATGNEDALISPPIDLNGYTRASFRFRLAYGYKPEAIALSDRLIVELSEDCGATFPHTLYSKAKSQLATQLIRGDTAALWRPLNCGDWREEMLSLDAYTGKEVRLRITFEKYLNGLPLYLDDFRLSVGWVTGLQGQIQEGWVMKVYPNPGTGVFMLDLAKPANQSGQVAIRGLRGNEIKKISLDKMANVQQWVFDLTGHAPGIYWVELNTEAGNLWQKLVVWP